MPDFKPTGSDLYSPALRLLTSIIKIASDDWDAINDETRERHVTPEGRIYCDKAHKSLCDKANFSDGFEELLSFFDSDHFDKICDEIGKDPERARRQIGIY